MVISGLTSAVLAVSGTVNLQFQGQFVSTSWRPDLRTVAAPVTAPVWSSVTNLVPPGGVFSIYETAQRMWLRILSLILEEKLKILDFA